MYVGHKFTCNCFALQGVIEMVQQVYTAEACVGNQNLPCDLTVVHVLAPHRFPQSRRLIIEPRNTFVQGLGLWSQVKRRACQLVLLDRLSAWRHHWLLSGSITVASIAGLSASFTGPALVLMVFLLAGA